MKLKHLLILPLIFALSACSNEKKDSQSGDSEAIAEKCIYAFNRDATKLDWTAYKFTEKAGVSGFFSKYEVTVAADSAGSLSELMDGMQFTLNPNSVKSGDTSRDRKIRQYFFGTMTDQSISGTIKNVSISGDKGRCEVVIMMNGNESSVLGDLAVNGDEVTMTTELDMNAWDAQSSVDALNEECKDLHTGPDGKSMLWPNVSIKVTSTVNTQNCDTGAAAAG